MAKWLNVNFFASFITRIIGTVITLEFSSNKLDDETLQNLLNRFLEPNMLMTSEWILTHFSQVQWHIPYFMCRGQMWGSWLFEVRSRWVFSCTLEDLSQFNNEFKQSSVTFPLFVIPLTRCSFFLFMLWVVVTLQNKCGNDREIYSSILENRKQRKHVKSVKQYLISRKYILYIRWARGAT